MIPIELQGELKKELVELFSSIQLTKATGYEGAINVYEQHLPIKKGKKDEDHYPCIIVKLIDGEDKEVSEPYTATIAFMVGIFDESEERQGHKDVMLILQKIYNHLMRKPMIAKRFECVRPIKWALTEEDFHPYYFGGIEASFTLPKMMREDVNYLL